MGRLQFQNIHHTFIGQLVEIEAVAHIVVGRHSFRIIVDHDRTPPALFHGEKSVDRAPVEFHRAADTVCTRPEHHHRTVVVQILHVVCIAVICEVQIVGHSRILCGKRIDLLHHRDNAELFAQSAHFGAVRHGIERILFDCASYLEIAETLLLGKTQQVGGNILYVCICFKLTLCADDVLQLLQEPAVNFGKLVDTVHGVAFAHGLGDNENTLVGRLHQRPVDVVDIQVMIANESVHPLPYHAQAFLNHLLECSADSHHFAHRLH